MLEAREHPYHPIAPLGLESRNGCVLGIVDEDVIGVAPARVRVPEIGLSVTPVHCGPEYLFVETPSHQSSALFQVMVAFSGQPSTNSARRMFLLSQSGPSQKFRTPALRQKEIRWLAVPFLS